MKMPVEAFPLGMIVFVLITHVLNRYLGFTVDEVLGGFFTLSFIFLFTAWIYKK